jgi:DNA-binding LacI/PurR family transcriptional regulator
VNALVLLGKSSFNPKLLGSLSSTKAIVSVAHAIDLAGVPAFLIDSRRSVELALDHLVALGHREILLLCTPESVEGQEHIAAFRAFYAGRRLAEPAEFVYPVDSNSQEGSPAAILAAGAALFNAVWARRPRPTALIRSGSLRSAALLRAAHGAGVRVPQDLSVVATADSPLVGYTVPALTAVDEHIAEIGRDAATLALDLLEAKTRVASVSAHVTEPELVIRESTGLAPRTA